jgi:uncharacterized membrane protein
MKSRKALWIVLVLVAVAAIVGYRMWNKPHQKVEDQAGVRITAATLCEAYSTNEATANTLYNGKAIEVSGTVAELTTTQDGGEVIRLQGNDAGMTVQCTMRDKGNKAAVNTPVVIKGFCSGSTMFDVVLTDCVLKQ